MCFIIWGKKAAQQYPLGYMAEHCARCNGVQAMQINSLRQASHLYYIPLGRGTLLGYVGVCQQCTSSYYVDPTNYVEVVKRRPANLFELIKETSPRFDESNPKGQAAWKRTDSLRKPLQAANAKLRDRYKDGSGRLDTICLLALAAMVLLPLFMSVELEKLNLPETASVTGGQITFGVFMVGLVAFLAAMLTERRRFFRRQVLPAIATDLKPLGPTEQELQASMTLMKRYQYLLPRVTTPAALMQAVEATR